MASKPLFEGLIVDEQDRFVEVSYIGGEAFYVVDDDGFLRHIESEHVDRQILRAIANAIEGHKESIAEGTMKMLGQEDIFTKAAIDSSLDNLEAHMEVLLREGLPVDVRNYLGMIGFRVVIDIHGEVTKVEQPAPPEGPFE